MELWTFYWLRQVVDTAPEVLDACRAVTYARARAHTHGARPLVGVAADC